MLTGVGEVGGTSGHARVSVGFLHATNGRSVLQSAKLVELWLLGRQGGRGRGRGGGRGEGGREGGRGGREGGRGGGERGREGERRQGGRERGGGRGVSKDTTDCRKSVGAYFAHFMKCFLRVLHEPLE